MIWFTSDHHFHHKNVIEYDQRPFLSIEGMNEVLISRWNRKVRPMDTVIYLGDFSLSKQALVDCLPQLHGEIHLIAGNHDHCHPVHAKSPEKIKRMTDLYLASGFKSVGLEDQISINKRWVKLCHMPYYGDHPAVADRYTQYRPKDEGEWLIHGHVHTAWKTRDHMINVGVCHWDYAPVSIDEIQDIIK